MNKNRLPSILSLSIAFFAACAFTPACSSSDSPSPANTDSSQPDADTNTDSSSPANDAANDATVDESSTAADSTADTRPDTSSDTGTTDKAAKCATSLSQLGTILTSGHGRIDGFVSAVVPPGDEACSQSANATHMTIEVLVASKIERVVITSTDTAAPDGKMFFLTKDAPLVGPAWQEGWHVGADGKFDYVNNLQVHGTDFSSFSMAELTQKISDPINIGDKISLFATQSDATSSDLYGTRAHLVHRYGSHGPYADGAIVIHPDTSPTYMLFYYLSEKNF